MKQGTAVNRIVMLLIALALALYFAGAAWNAFREPYPTAQAYAYAVDDTAEATGYLCRTEEVLTGTGGIVRVLPGEGEKVSAGATVARLYADRASVERDQRLETLRGEIDQLSSAIEAAGTPSQGDSTRSEVVDSMLSLRLAVAAGDFTRLESRTAAFKNAVYRQALRYGSAGELEAALAAAQAEAQSLEALTARETQRVTVAQSGVFSGQADGYESVLTPQMLDGLTPSSIDALAGQARPVGAAAIGKLITSSKWYFVCALPDAAAGRLAEGATITTRFSRDWSGEVDMKVERVGALEGGRRAVVLSSNRYLSQVTLLRRQTVELVFATKTGLRLPAGAVRVEEGQSVVYVLVGVKAEKKPVNILAQGEDYYLVSPLIADSTAQEQEKKALRAGDAVIIANQEIWDGKVVR